LEAAQESDEGLQIVNEEAEDEVEFQVQVESPEQKQMIQGLTDFFTKKAIVDSEDEKHKGVFEAMNLIDTLFVPNEKSPPRKADEFIGVPQATLNGIVNLRDLKGRTALHVAAAFGHKLAVETLLFLNANPHLEDVFGQRPIDLSQDDGVRDLLLNKMQRTTAPQLVPVPRVRARNLDSQKPVRKMSVVSQASSQSKKQGALLQQQYPLEIKDLRAILKEKIQIAKIGIENDNYL